MTWLQELVQTIGKVRETYYTQVSLLDKLIGELEAKQDQPEWELMQVSVSVPVLACCEQWHDLGSYYPHSSQARK